MFLLGLTYLEYPKNSIGGDDEIIIGRTTPKYTLKQQVTMEGLGRPLGRKGRFQQPLCGAGGGVGDQELGSQAIPNLNDVVGVQEEFCQCQ